MDSQGPPVAGGVGPGVPGRVEGGTPDALNAPELALLAVLDDAPLSVDRLVELLEAPVGELTSRLARLEVRGLVARTAAGYVISGRGAAARTCSGGSA